MYDNVTVAAPVEYDGFLLREHIRTSIGVNFFNRMILNGSNLIFNTVGVSEPDKAAIPGLVSSYVHPVDVGAERTLRDIVMEV